MNERLWIVLPCAGQGVRFKSTGSAKHAGEKQALAKQYALIDGRTVLTRVLERMQALAPARIVLVVAAGDELWQSSVPNTARSCVVTVSGGAHRAASVLNGLQALDGDAADQDWVLVHDVARPCVTREDCERLLAAIANDPAGGLLALPVTDTIKQVDVADTAVFAIRTVPREDLWYAQTPQVFRFAVLKAALTSAAANGVALTDEASAVELMGWRPRLVRGTPENLKITWPEDLLRAAAILATQADDA